MLSSIKLHTNMETIKYSDKSYVEVQGELHHLPRGILSSSCKIRCHRDADSVSNDSLASTSNLRKTTELKKNSPKIKENKAKVEYIRELSYNKPASMDLCIK